MLFSVCELQAKMRPKAEKIAGWPHSNPLFSKRYTSIRLKFGTILIQTVLKLPMEKNHLPSKIIPTFSDFEVFV
jgi:hypothetical protein